MSSYRLSSRAADDLFEIFLFGIDHFGHRQAERYKAELDRCFEMLADLPRIGRLAEPIGPGVRRHEHRSHVVLYREEEAGILILAVVHGRSVHGLEL